MRRLPLFLVLLVAAAPPVRAQSPTQQGARPNVPSDSIVRLALDPTRTAGRPLAVLLDESTIRLEPDGRWVQRTRQVAQVLDRNGVRAVAERAITYARSHQRVQLDWVRVLRLDGTVVSDSAAQDQEGDVAAAMSNPVFSDQRVRRLSLAGVAPGVVVDVAFTIEEQAPTRRGDFFVRWSLNGPLPVRRSRLVLDVPTSFEPRLVERNLVTRRMEEVAGVRRRITWSSVDQHPLPTEAFAADSNDLQQLITVAPASSWNDLAQWYDGLAQSRYPVSPGVARSADSVIAARGAKTRGDTIRALHRWVAQDVRYVSIALGIGSYQPRPGDEVLRAGAGDCKDKATLFIAALRRVGIEAVPVLLHLSGQLDAKAPSAMQFNHAIAAVREGSGWVYTDLTADLLPYGVLPDAYAGGRGLRIERSGDGALVELPSPSATTVASRTELHYELDAQGVAHGRGREHSDGSEALPLRTLFAQPLDDTRRGALTRRVAQNVGSDAGMDARVDALTAFDGRDLSAVAEMHYTLVVTNAARNVGSTRVLTVPVAMRGPARQFRAGLRELEAAGPRRLPIDASRIIPPVLREFEWVVTLPEGWTVDLPPPVNTSSFFGRYESTWTVQGRDLRMRRRLAGQRGIVGPERMVEVLVWLRTVSADDQEFLTMKPVPVKAPAGAR
jgi:transglutaminase-like putative cysteine protease